MEKNGWLDPKWRQYWGVDDLWGDDEADVEEPWDEY